MNVFLSSDLKLGLLGVTFVYSSGDFGVAGNFGMFVVFMLLNLDLVHVSYPSS